MASGVRLQRGRAFWGAEICGQEEGTSNINGLQRGRAFWGAEMRPAASAGASRCRASTGPRLLGRGDPRCQRGSGQPTAWLQRGRAFWGAEMRRFTRNESSMTTLQRGRAFWGAEIMPAPRFSPFKSGLQRGRAFWGAEIPPSKGARTPRQQASTGPRLLGRGDVLIRCRWGGECHASTGPRLLGRGDTAPNAVSVAFSVLQRGRAFWGAEMRQPRKAPCQTPRFNGAAPFGARRCRRDAPTLSACQPRFNGAAPFGARR